MNFPYNRAHIFNPGPSLLPFEVLEQAQQDIMNFEGIGAGIMEISHRSARFEALLQELKHDLRELLRIPETHEIIFYTGGATNQFSMVPMNLLKGGSSDHIITDVWSEKAFVETKKFGATRIAATSKESNFSFIPTVLD